MRTKFQPDWSMSLQARAIFKCAKNEENEKKVCPGNGFCDFLQIWFAVFLIRHAPRQQFWHKSDKRSQINICMKIATLLFLLVYSCSLRMPWLLRQLLFGLLY